MIALINVGFTGLSKRFFLQRLQFSRTYSRFRGQRQFISPLYPRHRSRKVLFSADWARDFCLARCVESAQSLMKKDPDHNSTDDTSDGQSPLVHMH